MNEREAARLIDYGHTEVTAPDGVRGVAVSVDMVPTLTIRQDDGTLTTAPLEDCERVE
jgi:hypothetical protein